MLENPLTSIIYYDNHCNLCHASVRFIHKYDKHNKFNFIPIQEMNHQISSCHTTSEGNILPDTIILKERNKTYIASDAVLQILRSLGFPWNTFYIFMLIPRHLRDGMYRFISRRRYRWFGKREK